jgi:hypothetical protein
MATEIACIFGVNALVDADYRALISPITPLEPQNK